jgi:hypothetical protein
MFIPAGAMDGEALFSGIVPAPPLATDGEATAGDYSRGSGTTVTLRVGPNRLGACEF